VGAGDSADFYAGGHGGIVAGAQGRGTGASVRQVSSLVMAT
jgi:hypothetical protein